MADQLISTAVHHKLPEDYVRPETQRPRLVEVVPDAHIPVVDLASPDRAMVVSQIGAALASHGFFQALELYHGISVELMLAEAHESFGLPPEEKAKLYSDDPAKKIRLSTSFNVLKETVHNWRDYLRLHCHPPEQFVLDWPANPPPIRTFNDEITDDVIFSVASSQEGGIDIEVGSSTMHMQKHCSVHHPVVQMVQFAIKHVSEDTFCCPHSMLPKAILDIIKKASVSKGAPLNSSGYGDSKMYALGLAPSPGARDWASSSTGTLMRPLWLDSGATHHAVGDYRILTNLRDLHGGMVVTVANGSQLAVTKVGDIRTPDIEIEDVYLVPGLEMDLVSVRQLAKSKIVTTFYENHAELWLEGRRIGGAIIDDAESLYRLRFLLAPCLHAIARHAASA